MMALGLYDGNFKDFFSLMRQTVFFMMDGSGRYITENTMFQKDQRTHCQPISAQMRGKQGWKLPPPLLLFSRF